MQQEEKKNIEWKLTQEDKSTATESAVYNLIHSKVQNKAAHRAVPEFVRGRSKWTLAGCHWTWQASQTDFWCGTGLDQELPDKKEKEHTVNQRGVLHWDAFAVHV